MSLAAYAVAAGTVTLIGWFGHVPKLTDWLDSGIAMFVNTAIAAVCAGTSLVLAQLRWRRASAIGAALAAVVLFLGAATLAEHLFGVRFRLGTLLHPQPWGLRASASPGQMGPPASLAFTLIGTALLLLHAPDKARKAVPALGIGAVAIAGFALIGYAFGADPLYSISRLTGIALQTATVLLALGLGILAAVPGLEPMRTLFERTATGLLARRILPLVIVLPVALGVLTIWAIEAHELEADMALALFVMALMPLFSVGLWWCLASLSAREMAARRNEERLASMAAIVESSDDAIIMKNLNGIIISWNNGAQRIFGYTAEEVIGKPVTILMPPDRENEEPQILARLRRGERIDHYETIRRRKDGTLLDISLTVSPVRDTSGQVIGASKIARDITEVRRARAALQRSHEELEKRVSERTASLQQAIAQMEEFSYSVSHDLRAPVRAMSGYAEAILEDYGDSLTPTAREYLKRILSGSSRMEQLIHDVLTYTRLARSEVVLKPTSLEKLVAEVIQQYPEMQPPAAEIEIKRPLQDVLAHEPSLTQAVSNLLSNGVKFVERGTRPKLQVWTEAHNGSVRLCIKDNGIGIDPKYHHRLFGMFERVHPNSAYEGTGIGLAIVRKAAEKMGGKAGLVSQQGAGSNFWIELPAAAREHRHS